MNRKLITIFAGAALMASQASATVIFSDDFSASGSGTGWAASTDWNSDVATSRAGANGTADTSDVTVAGGALTVTGDTNTDPATTAGTNTRAHRNLASSFSVSGSDSIWFSADIAYTGTWTGPEDAWFGVSFFAGGSEDIFFGANAATDFWSVRDAASSLQDETTINHYSTTSVFLLAEITTTEIKLWIDPADPFNPGTASATQTGSFGSTNWDRIRVGAGDGSTGSASNGYSETTLTNMIAATTLGEAIPEPSTALLGGLGLLALLRRRRA